MEPVSPALKGRFLTTGPAGSPLLEVPSVFSAGISRERLGDKGMFLLKNWASRIMQVKVFKIWRQKAGDLGEMNFPGGSDCKESARNVRDLGLIPGLGRFPEKEMATHSRLLVWKIPWM